MASIKTVSKLLLLWTLMNCVLVNSSKLNVPRVLLPIFREFNPSYTLEVTEDDGSCFTWKTTRPDIIKLVLIGEDPFLQCSNKVLVSAIGKITIKTIGIVLGDDIHSDTSLRCDVILDFISALDVVSKTRELYLTEAPEIFEVRALDSQGNEFSTLQGIEFNWKIVTLGKAKQAEIIRCMPFSAFDYEAPDDIMMLEAQNKKGYMALLEGVETGAAKVIVTLPFEEYSKLSVLEVPMSVTANIILQPAEVFLLAGDYVKISVFIIRNGKMEEIDLASHKGQYQIESKNIKLVKTSNPSGMIYALSVGTTEVYLLDRNVPQCDEVLLKPPTAFVHVVQPSHMVLSVLPHRNWAVLVGEKHDIVAEIYTADDRKLTLGLGVRVDIAVTTHFEIDTHSPNGTWISGWCMKKGIAEVIATLESLKNPIYGTFKLEKAIVAKGELLIFPRITITPPEVILPWDENVKPKFEIELVAKGGDGKFIWSSSDHSKGLVTQTGRVKTMSSGAFEISAAMIRNHHNRETVKMQVSRPAKLEILNHQMEAEVGYPVHVYVALFADKPLSEMEKGVYIPFVSCQDLPFQVTLSNDRFRYNRSDIVGSLGISCANFGMISFSPGSTKITISYMTDGKLLQDSATIFAYKAVKLEQPIADVVLAVGSIGQLVFTGGPPPDLSQTFEHYRVANTSDETIASIREVARPQSALIEDFTVIEVLCRKLGETDLTLKISNQAMVPNCENSPGTAIVRIYCSKPRTIKLRPEIQVVDVHTCPLDISADKVMVQSKQNVELDVIVLDDYGRRFLNISSFMFEWDVGTKAQLGTTSVFIRPHTFGSVLIPHRSFQVVMPKDDEKTVDVYVTIKGYNKTVLDEFDVVPEWPAFFSTDDHFKDYAKPIATRLQLTLVEEIKLDPNDTSLYNNPGNKEIINILFGSGYDQLHISSESIANVNYLEQTRQIEVTPLETGELIIQVVDLCLPTLPATAIVNVIAVGVIRIEMSHFIEVGKCIHAIVRLYDDNDNLIQLQSSDIIALNHAQTAEIVTLDRMMFDENGENWPPGEVHYLVTGVEIGKSKLSFSVNNGFLEVKSALLDLHVFKPLEIFPKNGSLLVGSSIQISTHGGPVPHLTLEYSAEPAELATIDSKGVVTGKALGEAKIRCKSVGLHPSSGKKLVYSEDETTVHIILLESIKIAAPLTRFRVDAEVPFWVTGVPEAISPMVLGSMSDPGIGFEWRVEDHDVATIQLQFNSLFIHYKKEDQLLVKIKGMVPGRTRVSLNASLPGYSTQLDKKMVIFSTFIDIEVFEDLKLIVPDRQFRSRVLIAPNCHIRLESNFDDISNLHFKLFGPFTIKQASIIGASEKENLAFNGVVGLSEYGDVFTYGTVGTAVVIMSAKDAFGLVQEKHIVVEVREVHYMMASLESEWLASDKLILQTLPVGADFEMHSTYYDNIGNKFDAGPTNIGTRDSRCDLIRIKGIAVSNNSIQVSLKKPGHTVLKLWAAGIQQTAYYVKIHAEAVTLPLVDEVTRGDIVCLFSPLIPKYHVGLWMSSDKSLMGFIEGTYDVAVVLANREGVVVLTHTLHPSAPKQIQVKPLQAIILKPVQKDAIITNSDERDSYTAHVVLHSDLDNVVKYSNLVAGYPCQTLVGQKISTFPFTCHIAFTNRSNVIKATDIFNVKSIFLPKEGQYGCQLMSLKKNQSQASILETSIYIFAMSVDDPEIVSQKLKVPFLPGVWSPSEVQLDDNGMGSLTVTGLPKILDELLVFPSDSSILYVSNGKIEGHKVSYDIRILDYHWRLADVPDAMSIIVMSKITNQTYSIFVKVKFGFQTAEACVTKETPIRAFLRSYRNVIVVLFSMIVVFASTFYVYSRFLQPVVNVNLTRRSSIFNQSNLTQDSVRRFSGGGGYNFNTSLQHPPECDCNNCAGKKEPIYGDVSSFYNTSPELRRNRRFI